VKARSGDASAAIALFTYYQAHIPPDENRNENFVSATGESAAKARYWIEFAAKLGAKGASDELALAHLLLAESPALGAIARRNHLDKSLRAWQLSKPNVEGWRPGVDDQSTDLANSDQKFIRRLISASEKNR
jgi:hypothetical protein